MSQAPRIERSTISWPARYKHLRQLALDHAAALDLSLSAYVVGLIRKDLAKADAADAADAAELEHARRIQAQIDADLARGP